MTKPTHAQIDAAKFGIVDLMNRNPDASWDEVAKAALTAAAEVGPNQGMLKEPLWPYTAAVEVGRPLTRLIEQHTINVELATIERCAQVAEDWQYIAVPDKTIAAAIRTLKDKQ